MRQSFKKTLLSLLLLCANVTVARAATSKIVDIALAYSITMLSTIAHEAGHAAAIKLLYNETCDLNIGSYKSSDTIFKLGRINFKFPMLPIGYVKFYSYGKDHAKDIAIFLSGPIMGSIAGYLCLKLLQLKYPNNADYPLSKFIADTEVSANFLNLLPIPGFDGFYVLESLGKLINRNEVLL